MKGICSVCGCVEAEACEEGCAWANRAQTLCTACVNLTTKARAQKREESLENLVMRLEAITDEALELKARMAVLEPTVHVFVEMSPPAKKRKDVKC